MPLRPSRRSWEISREHVEVIKVIGKGAFSEVAKATLRNMRDNKEIITVAAKMLKGEVVVLDLSLHHLVNYTETMDYEYTTVSFVSRACYSILKSCSK